MPRILVTNDDGIHSEGLIALAEALTSIGEVTVVAPATEQSAKAHSLTITHPLHIRKIDDFHYSVDGTPTDCVILALMKIMPEHKPEIVVSGINFGANLGDDVMYSGTVAGAFEGSVFGLPSVAVSLTDYSDMNFSYAAKFAAKLTAKILQIGLTDRTILNVNVPPGEILGARWTQQGTQSARSKIFEGVDPRGKNYCWIGEQHSRWKEKGNSDYAAIEEGLVSITPIKTDQTDYLALEKLRSIEL